MAKKKRRTSGEGMREAAAFAVRADEGWMVDIGAVRAGVDEYLKTARQEGRYSVAGLCLSLGIMRDTLHMWRRGYACADDETDADIAPNERLAQAAETGLLHIQKHWEEDGSSGVQSKYVKMLESSGALGERPQGIASQPLDMGALGKYCK